MHIAIPLKTMTTTTDKLRAIEEIWTDLVRASEANESESVPSPSWHTDVLRAREQRIADGAVVLPGYGGSQASGTRENRVKIQVLEEAITDLADDFRFARSHADAQTNKIH
uniref:Addiction module component n=1 Tax=Candidatus Kentrum sp. LPFa TaxID=2126335 RepID=A0A450WX26_9GAMM|nr:MAG: Putative addiction module component [Candidatus Kentron sp. LPFa]